MSESLFMSAQEVAKVLGTSKAYAYKMIQKMNQEMQEKGYLIISGKVNRTYFYERMYGKRDEDYGSIQRQKN